MYRTTYPFFGWGFRFHNMGNRLKKKRHKILRKEYYSPDLVTMSIRNFILTRKYIYIHIFICIYIFLKLSQILAKVPVVNDSAGEKPKQMTIFKFKLKC